MSKSKDDKSQKKKMTIIVRGHDLAGKPTFLGEATFDLGMYVGKHNIKLTLLLEKEKYLGTTLLLDLTIVTPEKLKKEDPSLSEALATAANE